MEKPYDLSTIHKIRVKNSLIWTQRMKTFWRRHNKAWHVTEGNIEVTGPEVWGKSWRNYDCLKYLKEKYNLVVKQAVNIQIGLLDIEDEGVTIFRNVRSYLSSDTP